MDIEKQHKELSENDTKNTLFKDRYTIILKVLSEVILG